MNKILSLPNENFDYLDETFGNLSKRNTHSLAYFSKGYIFWHFQGDAENSILSFKNAIKLDPSDRFSRNNLKETERLQYLQINPSNELRVNEIRYLTSNDSQSQIKRSIVKVISRFWSEKKGTEFGTGWVIHRQNDEAWIITNRHAVVEGNQTSQNVEVELFYGNVPNDRIPPRLPVKQVFATEWNDAVDLAVLRVDFTGVPDDIQALSLTQDESNSQLNLPVSVVGNSDFKQVSGNIVGSSQQQLVLDFLLEYGHSGSPVLNAKNQVIGVIYQRDSKEGKSLAIPISSVIQKLREWEIPLP